MTFFNSNVQPIILVVFCCLLGKMHAAILPIESIDYKALLSYLETASKVDEKLAGLPQDYFNTIVDFGYEAEKRTEPSLVGVEWLNDFKIDDHPEVRSKFEKAILDIQNGSKFVSKLDGSNVLRLPLGITGTLGEATYYLGFDNLKLYPTHATLDIIAGLNLPGFEQMLLFGATEVKYNNQSGFFGEVKLALVSDFALELNKGHSAIVFRGYRKENDSGSYLMVDCDGVKSGQLGIQAVFHPDLLIPLNKNQKYVHAYSEIKIDQDNGLLVKDLSLTPFYFTDFEDIAFSINNMALDLSEETSVDYIGEYKRRLAADTSKNSQQPTFTSEQWTGFYCEEFEMILVINTSRLMKARRLP